MSFDSDLFGDGGVWDRDMNHFQVANHGICASGFVLTNFGIRTWYQVSTCTEKIVDTNLGGET